VLNSGPVWRWLQIEGDPKKGGWRGVDKTLLERLPVPKLTPQKREQLNDLVRRIEAACANGQPTAEAVTRIDEIVSGTFGLTKKKVAARA